MQFLHEKNTAGQTLLRLCARGNAVIAELLRLSASVPAPFLLASKSDQRKYSPIVIDFAYLDREQGRGPDRYESVVDASPTLQALDAEFKETYLKKLGRYYRLFEVIWQYGEDFRKYIEDIEGGHYIQHTLEGILLDPDGKQLLCEALYLLGAMLLLLDLTFDGVIRERLVISYLRYKGQTELENLDSVAKLIERTGYTPQKNSAKPPQYPEKYFARVNVPKNAVKMIIGRLRGDDVYNAIPAYPLPEHRSAALATQAAMLFVCLYFTPQTLATEEAVMREVVDKHFPDNWVVPFYLGFTVDLTVEWDRYPAAKMALANTTQAKLISSLGANVYKTMDNVLKQLNIYLDEGTLTEDYILRNRMHLLASLRESNVTLRWLMLHTRESCKRMRDLLPNVDQGRILELLMKTAQFEFRLNQVLQGILDSKEEKWNNAKTEAKERIAELAEVFSGAKPLTRVQANQHLQTWFTSIADQINNLDYNDKTVAGRRIQQLIRALEEVMAYHQIETNMPVRTFIVETNAYLGNMVRLLNVNESVMVIITLASDIAYAREIVFDYIPQMQDRIRGDPGTVLLLRSTFLKLASILQIPLVRIGQASVSNEAMARDMVSVSEYYSKELVNFVRRVLEIIPEMMFHILAEIIDIQTNQFREMPMRVEKEEIEQYAQLPVREKLAHLCFQVSQFTEGILAMQTTLVGIVQVEPHALLEEGIRRILVRRISASLDRYLRFEKGTLVEFDAKLRQLKKLLEGFRNSFNYIQDYVNIYGLKIWQEEFQRIVNFNTEQECNKFLKQVHEGARSQYQSKFIPIPAPQKIKGDPSNNFIGRVGRALLAHTDAKKTVFLHKLSAWYTREEQEVVSLRTFDVLIDSLGVFGVVGIDRFYGFSIVKDLQVWLGSLKKLLAEHKGKLSQYLNALVKRTQPLVSMPERPSQLYAEVLKQFPSQVMEPIAAGVATIGQKQLLRRQLTNIINFRCKMESNSLFSSLLTFNESLLNDIQAHYRDPAIKPYPQADNPLLGIVESYLNTAGLSEPFSKIYFSAEPLPLLAPFLFVLVVKIVPRLTFDAYRCAPPSSKKPALDEAPFVIGLVTLLRQFHPDLLEYFFAMVAQFIQATLDEHLAKNSGKSHEPSLDVIRMLYFVEMFVFFADLDHDFVDDHIPAYLWSCLRPDN